MSWHRQWIVRIATHPKTRDASCSKIVVVDLGSTNGTMVNGIKTVGEQPLNDGDIISVGATHIRFEAS